ncbi:MAG: YhbD family protein [Thermoflavifilum sp.]|nr:YhbD family protein [Thermoflavifilum sp.]MCL6514738.1 YhbD family protein [Alicyclobacillus sp.]
MDEELISKKELLDLTGISYGQLYRWKRKRLIPEEWFIRKSTFTGQETFFPRDKILARIELIRNMKEDLSLDEIATKVSPVPDVTLRLADLEKHHIVTSATATWCRDATGTEVLVFGEALALSVINQLIADGSLTWPEADIVWRTLRAHYERFADRAATLVFVRKLGVSTCALLAARQEGGADIEFDPDAHVVARVDLTTAAEALKLRVLEMEDATR